MIYFADYYNIKVISRYVNSLLVQTETLHYTIFKHCNKKFVCYLKFSFCLVKHNLWGYACEAMEHEYMRRKAKREIAKFNALTKHCGTLTQTLTEYTSICKYLLEIYASGNVRLKISNVLSFPLPPTMCAV